MKLTLYPFGFNRGTAKFDGNTMGIRAIIMLVLITIPSLVLADEMLDGWGNAKWGMTVDEVAKAYNGQVTAINEKRSESINFLLALKQTVALADHNFDVAFSFDSETKLNAVVLHCGDESSKLFDDVYSMMLSKYKNPLKNEWKKDIDGTETDVFWSESIVLKSMEPSTGKPFVIIIYRSLKD